jgi:predicted helicase
MMAGKAKLLALVIENALNADLNPNGTEVHEDANNTLREQLKAFQDILIHDITPKEFADIYSQTIAYGMFAARLHDPDLDTFSRVEAAERIPKTNPFLRKLFQYVAGYDLDTRIQWIVDALADIFRATDVRALISNFGKATKQQDPIIHFYETFLSEYDPKLRKARGVWYTPEPVVNFIVRAVDDILKTEFELPQGLADSSKTKIKVEVQGKKVEQEVHRVQILDPATGTGTFLAEVIKQIHEKFKGQEGIWSNYVENHLIPRLNGFELLMASYAMAHLKLDLLLTETGFKPTKEQRFRVYLTNSLEEYHPETGTLFANWLSTEANEANRIKRDTPVMVVIGNPPYSGESSNKGEWIMKLMEDYKKESGGKEKLKEKNIKWLNDDYCKFIRLGQHLIEKSSRGVIALITPHGFIDAPTFRGMRWNLLKSFDKLFLIDLHGNARKNEVCLDGSPDENVFDIIQGVCISIFIKKGFKNQTELGKVFTNNILGKRSLKYEYLLNKSTKSIEWVECKPSAPEYYFNITDYSLKSQYENGFAIQELMPVNGVGICSKRDSLAFQNSKDDIYKLIEYFKINSEEDIKAKFKINTESRDQKVIFAKQNIIDFGLNQAYFKEALYRPFDFKWTYYTNRVRGFLAYPVHQIMRHFLSGNNFGLCLVKAGRNKESNNYFITNRITTKDAISSLDSINVFPLYLYPENYLTNDKSNITAPIFKTAINEFDRIPNLDKKIVDKISKALKLEFTSEKTEANSNDKFSPIDIQDFIYSVFYSNKYRVKYKDFLKLDLPRVPYPTNKDTFWKLVELGSQLRQIHLLESPKIEQYITKYPISGTNEVDKIKYSESKVYINETQYFEGVPEVAWTFYIGGYQPAQKWLKDRKGRTLNFEDILQYQKIIVALVETDRLMKEIDAVIEF